jgi:hypothetical protein
MYPAEAEDDCPLILAKDLDRVEKIEDDNEDDDQDRNAEH